jgi:membrane-associated phospholipid phosphatase
MSHKDRMRIDRYFFLRADLRDKNPPGVFEFLLMTILCSTAIVCFYFGLDDRNHALLAQGFPFFAPKTRFDDALPLVPEMIWAYYLFYPSFFAVAAITLANRRGMYEAVVTYVTTAAAAFLIFLLLPSRMEQPDVATCLSLSCRLLNHMYGLDDGFNIFPSLHVAFPVAVWFMFRTYSPKLVAPFGVVVVLIMASTVLLKRHYLWDMPTGALLGYGTFRVGQSVGGALAKTLGFLDRLEPADRV